VLFYVRFGFNQRSIAPVPVPSFASPNIVQQTESLSTFHKARRPSTLLELAATRHVDYSKTNDIALAPVAQLKHVESVSNAAPSFMEQGETMSVEVPESLRTQVPEPEEELPSSLAYRQAGQHLSRVDLPGTEWPLEVTPPPQFFVDPTATM
jgi:hypothetical protein